MRYPKKSGLADAVRLYLVTDPDMSGERSIEDVVAAAVRGGVTMVQLRDKQAEGGPLLGQARRLLRRLPPQVPLIVNDRLDVALAAGAAGVHVGQSDLPCPDARRLAPHPFWIGVSVSTVEEARRAEADGADYLGVSPVFDTPTKTDTPRAAGLEGLRAIRAAVRLPLVAIGGMTAGNAAAVRAVGADGIAVVSSIMAAADPEASARALGEALLHRDSAD